MLIRYRELVASYHNSLGNTKLIIRCSGMPGLPDDNDPAFSLLQKSWYDVVKPDYYGYARSGGLFTPSWCVQTVLDTAETFRQGRIFDVWGNQELTVSYDEIVLVWSSFGGWVACMAPKFDATIKEVVLCYPWFPNQNFGQIWYAEETIEEYQRQCRDWYTGVIRRWDESAWEQLYSWVGEFSILSECKHLKNVSLFLWHGTADECIHYSRTRDFCEQLKTLNPNGDYHYAEYFGLGHGWICKQAIIEGWLRKKMQLSK